jgi:ubiquinone/menaquinone biosynthesis C-methylase UbiE
MEEHWLVISFDRVAEIYDETRGFPSSVMAKIVSTLIRELEGQVDILDVGVGTGRISKPLQNHGYHVVGIDVSLEMLKKAVEKGMGNLVGGNICNLPFKGNSFDVTISTGLLHLVKEWKSALREVSRVTRKFLISVVRAGKSPTREEYRDALAEYGWKFSQLGIAERELGAIAKPVKSIEVTSYEDSSEKTFAFLERKAYSYQWDVPEEIHRRVMQQLTARFFPEAYPVKVEVLVWDIENICDLIQYNKN